MLPLWLFRYSSIGCSGLFCGVRLAFLYSLALLFLLLFFKYIYLAYEKIMHYLLFYSEIFNI